MGGYLSFGVRLINRIHLLRNWQPCCNFARLYPKTMKRWIVFLLLNACSVVAVMSQTVADSVRIRFRPGSSRIESGYDSGEALSDFLEKVRRCAADGTLERIFVRAYTSPDGVSTDNQRLSADRCRSAANCIVARTGIDVTRIELVPCGIAWEELRRRIAADDCVPGRRRALDILDHTPIWVCDAEGKVVGGRKKSLMDFRGGETYQWLHHHFFDGLHYALAVLYVKRADESSRGCAPRHFPSLLGDTARIAALIAPPAGVGALRRSGSPAMPEAELPGSRFALKTNLLSAAALFPSVELEWRLGACWTMAVEGNMAWWKRREEHRCYQLAVTTATVRRWFARGSLRRGFYVGAFAGAGLYDFENGRKGYRGEGVLAGLSVGYLWPLGRRLAIEAEGGAGWMTTRYKEYVPYEGHHLYLRTQHMDFFGPLRLKLALVWLLGRTAGRGKEEGGGK